jgi:hypothetical protein
MRWWRRRLANRKTANACDQIAIMVGLRLNSRPTRWGG